MNIIEKVRQILTDYPDIEQFTGNIHVDFTQDSPGEFGLYSTGDSLVGEDVLGDQIRQCNFILYAINQPFEDYDRLCNSSFLLELGYWLDSYQEDGELTTMIAGKEIKGKLKQLKCANAMLFMPADEGNGNSVYQLQIAALYEMEEL